MYVVVVVGDTTNDPFGETLPTPGVTETIVAFRVAYTMVADSPAMMFIGLAVQLRIWGWGFVTVTVAVAVSWLVSFFAVKT
jgi:hypothetical protein